MKTFISIAALATALSTTAFAAPPAPSSWTPPERVKPSPVRPYVHAQPKKVGGGFAAPAFAAPAFAAPAFAAPAFAAPNLALPNYAAPNYSSPNFAAPNYAAPNTALPTFSVPNYAAPAATSY